MVVVIRVKPIYIERLIYGLVILMLLSSTLYFYLKSEQARENNTIIVTNNSQVSTSTQTETSPSQELNISELEEEVSQQTPSPPPVQEEEPEETCDDNIRNQDETDVDCGGVCDDCPEEEQQTSPAAADVEFSVGSYKYEWKSTYGRLSDVEVAIVNNLGEDITDGRLFIYFYGASDPVELRDSSTRTNVPYLEAGGNFWDVLKRGDGSSLSFSCCSNAQTTQKTLKVVFESKDHDIKKTVTVNVK